MFIVSNSITVQVVTQKENKLNIFSNIEYGEQEEVMPHKNGDPKQNA